MARGIVFGAIWGLIVGGVVLAVASLLGEVPGGERPTAAVVEVPAGSEFDQSRTDRPVSVPTQDAPVVATGDAPLVTAPEAPVAPALSGDVTAPALVPQTDAGVASLAPPPLGAADSGVVLRAEVAPEEADSTPTVDPVADSESVPPVDESTPPPPVVTPETPSVDETEEAAAETIEEAPVAPTATTEASEETKTRPEAPVNAEPTTEVAALDAGQQNEPEPQPEQAAEPETAEPAQRPQASSGGFGNLAGGVTVNRPTTGSIVEDREEAGAEEAPDPNLPPLQAYAATDDWAGPDDRPLFSIILVDEAADASRLPALGSFQAPLTFAIPADKPGANAAMAAYRAAGHEVVLLANLPEGAAPSDIEVAMQAYLSSVPEAIAVLDGSLAGFRGDRDVAQQVAEILAGSGHGLVTFSQGLNTTAQIANRAGVPVGTIFRDLDAEGQGNTVIRRFLDQAAFRASQEGQAILLARMRAETISALLIWHQQDRAGRVNIAPLSAILSAN